MHTIATSVARVADSLAGPQLARAYLGEDNCQGCAPELPLWQPPHKWPELVVARGRQRRLRLLSALFDLVREEVVLQRGVKFGLEEGEEQVEEVDCLGV